MNLNEKINLVKKDIENRFPGKSNTVRILLWDDGTDLVECRYGSNSTLHISKYYNNLLSYEEINIEKLRNGMVVDEFGKEYFPRESFNNDLTEITYCKNANSITPPCNVICNFCQENNKLFIDINDLLENVNLFVVPLPNKNLNKMEKLSLNDVRKKLNFSRSSANLTMFQVMDLFNDKYNTKLDFDVYLPTKGINLQRPLIWTEQQKSEFILSIFKEHQIPKFSLIKNCTYRTDTFDDEYYEVIDGKQRLTTIITYVKNEFPLNVNGNKYFFDDLDTQMQNLLMRFHIEGTLGYSYPDKLITDQEKIDWFEQINFLGTPQDVEHLNNLKR